MWRMIPWVSYHGKYRMDCILREISPSFVRNHLNCIRVPVGLHQQRDLQRGLVQEYQFEACPR